MNHKLIAAKGITYGGKWRNAGEAFEATGQDARLLVAIRHATHAPADEPKPAEPAAETPAPEAPAVVTRDLAADEPKAAEAVPAVKAGRGHYNRRDLRAK